MCYGVILVFFFLSILLFQGGKKKFRDYSLDRFLIRRLPQPQPPLPFSQLTNILCTPFFFHSYGGRGSSSSSIHLMIPAFFFISFSLPCEYQLTTELWGSRTSKERRGTEKFFLRLILRFKIFLLFRRLFSSLVFVQSIVSVCVLYIRVLCVSVCRPFHRLLPPPHTPS